MNDTPHHIPVLINEITTQLCIKKTDIVLDGTLGFGGHSCHFLKHLQSADQLYCIDQDMEAIAYAQKKLPSETHIYHGNFSDFTSFIPKNMLFDKVLVDLGYSSYQLDRSNRGFSHQGNERLDMRMNTQKELTAADILNSYSFKELSDVFFSFGELHHNKKLCHEIINTRKKKTITSTESLVEIIKKSYSFNNKRSLYMKIAAQVFQALRIEVNKEFDHLSTFIHSIHPFMREKGRIAIITFHSIEDRLVKHAFREMKPLFTAVNKHVITASQEEISYNSRSKPAKLRVYEKIAHEL
jgi:16S rRNA (cytosine1402-N4)-methyltransferase